MATPPQGDQGPQPGAGGPVGPAQPGAMPGDPNVVLQQLAQTVSMLATATSSQQSQASVKESRFVKAPDVFAPKSLDEELSGWPEWAFCFKNWLSVQDDAFREDLKRVETATSIVAFDSYEAGAKTRAIRLYAILATYLRNRPLRILRSVTDGDGFRVWRALVDELQPSSRPRALMLKLSLSSHLFEREAVFLIILLLSNASWRSTRRLRRTLILGRFEDIHTSCRFACGYQEIP